MKKNGNQNHKRKKQEVDILIENEDGTEITSIEEINIKTHPDGEWGWCVVMAAFLTQFVVVGLQNSSGVIFNELVEKFNRPRGETGKIILPKEMNLIFDRRSLIFSCHLFE